MQIIAKLSQVLPIQTGTGKNGIWKKQDIIVDTDGQYPKKICISIWGDKIHESQLLIGNLLKIDFEIESREYNERWYTELKAWKISIQNNTNEENNISPSPLRPIEDNPFTNNEDEILPF
jgi:hypothetical protein